MSALVSTRVGWCPGAFTPMATGDGLIVRIKPRSGILTPGQSARIARTSRAFGNGDLDLTTRANLQLRGAGEETLPDLLQSLRELDLVDPDAASEAVRNVVSSPLAGLDPSAVLDIRPCVAALEARLVADRALEALPTKFSVLVDDGGRLGLADVPADIRFEACRDAGKPVFAIRLGGADDAIAGRCAPSDIGQVAAALASAFLNAQSRDPEIRRMRHLVERIGPGSILRQSGLTLFSPPRREAPSPQAFVGILETEVLVPPGARVVGIAAPFGRLKAEQLETLAAVASEAGAPELRLTPWRAILVPGLTSAGAERIAAVCAAAGMIVDGGDPRLRVAACPGAPGCHRGTTPVLDHAARLAALLPTGQPGPGILLHVSGCSKGCAHPGKAPLTLVGHDGAYDLVTDGCAGDRPSAEALDFMDTARYFARSIATERQP